MPNNKATYRFRQVMKKIINRLWWVRNMKR
jgi:hypothetical protein